MCPDCFSLAVFLLFAHFVFVQFCFILFFCLSYYYVYVYLFSEDIQSIATDRRGDREDLRELEGTEIIIRI